MFNSLVEEALRQNNIAAILTKAFLMCAARKMSHFSMSQSSPDSSAIPCGAHLVGFSCLCFSQSTLLALPLPCPPVFLSLSLPLSIWQSTHAKSSCSEQRCLLMKTQGKCSGNYFHFVKDGAILFFCVQHDQAQLFAQFNTNCLTNGFSSSVFPQPLLRLQLCWDYVRSCNLFARACQKKMELCIVKNIDVILLMLFYFRQI